MEEWNSLVHLQKRVSIVIDTDNECLTKVTLVGHGYKYRLTKPARQALAKVIQTVCACLDWKPSLPCDKQRLGLPSSSEGRNLPAFDSPCFLLLPIHLRPLSA
jgi:hypothetical protein